MKKSTIKILCAAVIVIAFLILSMIFVLYKRGQENYKNGLVEVSKTDLTDLSIILTMEDYGFYVDAMETEEPSVSEYIYSGIERN